MRGNGPCEREKGDRAEFSVLKSVCVCTRQPMQAWLFSDVSFFRFRVGKLRISLIDLR